MSYSKKKTDRNQSTHHKRRTVQENTVESVYSELEGTRNLVHYKTIKDRKLCPHCQGVINSSSVHALLAPQFTDSSTDSACLCNSRSCVVKSKPKVKWTPNNVCYPAGYKTTTSKYHTRCIERPQKPKVKIVIPKKLVASTPFYTDSTDTSVYKNECYCRKKKIPPLLPCKPFDKQSPCIRNGAGRHKVPAHELGSSHSLPTLRKAKELLDYRPESEFLNRLRKEAKATFDCQCTKCKLDDEMPNLKFTASRQLLEEHYDDAKRYNINEIWRNKHSCLKDTSSELGINKDLPPYGMREGPMTTSSATNCATIHSIRHIRDENYFDTHSTEYLDRQQIPEHVCVHNFSLNERLLPEALNTDPYGVSRCRICNKPMENRFVEHKNRPVASSLQRIYSGDVSQYFTTVDSYSDEPITPDSKYLSKAVQTTPKIRVKEHIIYLPLIADPRLLKMKRPYVPENSWALRYQKMY